MDPNLRPANGVETQFVSIAATFALDQEARALLVLTVLRQLHHGLLFIRTAQRVCRPRYCGIVP